MSKETIEQIKKIPGVKVVTSVSEQFPNSENTVIVVFEPEVNYKDLILQAFMDGRLLEYKDKGSSEWKLWSKDTFDWGTYDYRIADPSEHWLGAVADINKSLANRIMEWFGNSVTYERF